MQRLEVAADRDRLGDAGAVVELEHRQPAHRIDLEEFGLAVFGRRYIHLLQRNRDSLFGQEDAHAARIWSLSIFVDFHSGCNLKLCCDAVNPRALAS